MLARLTMVTEKIQNPQPMLNDIVKEFQIMEAQRFKNSGQAPEFGITNQWQPLAEATIEEREQKGISGNRPLKAYGFLSQAATNPQVTIKGKTITFDIDPRRFSGEREFYDENVNYGIYHQLGQTPEEGTRGKREFVTFTPAFGKYVKMIIAAHLKGEITGVSPVYRDIGTAGGRGNRGRARKTWTMKQYSKRHGRREDIEDFKDSRGVANLRNPEEKINYSEYAHRMGYGDLVFHYDRQWYAKNSKITAKEPGGAISRKKLIERARSDYKRISDAAQSGKYKSLQEIADSTGIHVKLVEFHYREMSRYRDEANHMTKAGFTGRVMFRRTESGSIEETRYGDWNWLPPSATVEKRGAYGTNEGDF